MYATSHSFTDVGHDTPVKVQITGLVGTHAKSRSFVYFLGEQPPSKVRVNRQINLSQHCEPQ